MIHKIGLCVVQQNRILLCRKNRDTALLIVPGGKIDPGESDVECLEREIREELGTGVRVGLFLGSYSGAAAGAEHVIVRVDLYSGELTGAPVAQAEIAELVWFGPEDDFALLSETLRVSILPDLIARGVLKKR